VAGNVEAEILGCAMFECAMFEYGRASAMVCSMDTLDTRFKRIADAIRALDEEEREDVLGAFEDRLFETESESLLTPEQIEEVERRLAGPLEIATQDQVDAVFAKHGFRK
jgi:hypothetical protein